MLLAQAGCLAISTGLVKDETSTRIRNYGKDHSIDESIYSVYMSFRYPNIHPPCRAPSLEPNYQLNKLKTREIHHPLTHLHHLSKPSPPRLRTRRVRVHNRRVRLIRTRRHPTGRHTPRRIEVDIEQRPRTTELLIIARTQHIT